MPSSNFVELPKQWQTLTVILTGSAQPFSPVVIWARTAMVMPRTTNAGTTSMGTDISAQNISSLPFLIPYSGQPWKLGDWYLIGTANDVVDILYM